MKYILGISDSHDSGAALIDTDGNIICAINEERLSREKIHVGMPYLAIKEILYRTKINPADIEQVTLATIDFLFALMFGSKFFKMRRALRRKTFWTFLYDLFYPFLVLLYRTKITIFIGKLWRPKKWTLKKYLAGLGINAPITLIEHHNAHASSAYYTGQYNRSLIITMDTIGDALCTTVNIGEDGKIKRIFSQKWPENPTSFYSSVTQLLGFMAIRHEGKVLGLAAYGDYKILIDKFRKLVGKWIIGNYSAGVNYLKKLCAGQKRENIAAAVQKVTEEFTLSFVREWIKKTGIHDLVCAGGLFANVIINQKILELEEVNSIFIHPAMGDTGLALGSALFLLSQKITLPPKPLENVYFGFQYTDDEIISTAKKYNLNYKIVPNLPIYIAELLKAGKIVGLYQGRMEYGPRALGNRTILANPSDPNINNWLNKRLNRTEFMPFAPVVCEEDASKCFKNYDAGKYPAKFMTITFDAQDECRKLAPAICHVDNTARPQTIDRKNNPLYYDIIKEFYRLTGIPVLINTSFNMHEEPIVASPDDAIRSFLVGAVDVLVMEKYVIES